MKTFCTKEFTFDCSHMLTNYDGACKNLHGHTYKLQVTVTGGISTTTGMIVDFKELNDLVKENIIEKFDHAFICNGAAGRYSVDNDFADFCAQYSKKVMNFPGLTTCENMATYMFVELDGIFIDTERPFELHSIKLWETPTSFCEVTR